MPLFRECIVPCFFWVDVCLQFVIFWARVWNSFLSEGLIIPSWRRGNVCGMSVVRSASLEIHVVFWAFLVAWGSVTDQLHHVVILFWKALPGQQTPDNCPSFKLVIVGDGGTGRCTGLAKPCDCWVRSLLVHGKHKYTTLIIEWRISH
jgi:hypothetical protein